MLCVAISLWDKADNPLGTRSAYWRDSKSLYQQQKRVVQAHQEGVCISSWFETVICDIYSLVLLIDKGLKKSILDWMNGVAWEILESSFDLISTNIGLTLSCQDFSFAIETNDRTFSVCSKVQNSVWKYRQLYCFGLPYPSIVHRTVQNRLYGVFALKE